MKQRRDPRMYLRDIIESCDLIVSHIKIQGKIDSASSRMCSTRRISMVVTLAL